MFLSHTLVYKLVTRTVLTGTKNFRDPSCESTVVFCGPMNLFLLFSRNVLTKTWFKGIINYRIELQKNYIDKITIFIVLEDFDISRN